MSRSRPTFWEKHFPRSEKSSGNRKTEEEPSSNASTSEATVHATVGFQEPLSSKHAALAVRTIDPDVPLFPLPVESTPTPQKLLLPDPKTQGLLGDQYDAWDEAYKKIESERPKVFRHYKCCIAAPGDGSITPPQLELDDLTSELREQYFANQIKKRLQTNQAQERSTADNVYQKIVKTVVFAKDFVGQAASNEPHAALAWAGVSMLLPLLLKPDAQRTAATKGLEFISDLMLEYRVIEKTFRQRSRRLQTTPSQAEMDLIINAQSKIVHLYGQILEFQFRMTYYYSRQGFTKYMRDLGTSDDWQEMTTAIVESHEIIGRELGIIGHVHLDNALDAQDGTSKQMEAILQSIQLALTRMENSGNDVGEAKGNQLLAGPSTEVSSFRVPFERNLEIVVRKVISGRLEQLLPNNKPYKSVALWGLGGSGKTQIALEFAYSRRESTGCSVFWVNCATTLQFLDDFQKISAMAQLSADLKGTEMLAAVRGWLESRRNWLLILDNADSLDLFQPRGKGIEPSNDTELTNLYDFIPRGEHGMILWTSRDARVVGSLVHPKHGVEVGRMDLSESTALLDSLCDVEHGSEMKTLLEFLEYLPLAISQAAAYMSVLHITLHQYMEKLQSQERRYQMLRSEFHDTYRPSGVPNSVLYAWQISMDHISAESECAREIMDVLGFVDHERIPLSLLEAAGNRFNEEDILKAMGRLQAFSFLRKERPEPSGAVKYSLHRLVHLSLQYSLQAQVGDSTRPVALGRALNIMNGLFPSGEHDTWNLCEIYATHAFKVCEHAVQHVDRFTKAELQSHLGRYFFEMGRSKEAMVNYREVVELRIEVLGESHPSTLESMGNLASIYWQQGRTNEAEVIETKVLKLRKEVLGEKHPDTVKGMNNLAATYFKQGQLKEAEVIETKVLKLQKEVLGEKHPDTVQSMGNLATIYLQQGRSKEAEVIDTKVLELQKEVLGEKHPDTVRSMNNLAATYFKQGRLKEAEVIKTKVLELQKEVLGEKHPDTLSSMSYLALMYLQQGRSKEAEVIKIKVLELRKEVLGEKHPVTLRTIANLAVIRKSLKLDS